MLTLPFTTYPTNSTEKPKPSRSTCLRAWLPALAACAMVASAFLSASTVIELQPLPQSHRSLLVQEHHSAVFGASAPSSATGSSSWFSDAAKPVGEFTSSTATRQKWGTARAYPPSIDGSAEGRALYEAHIDVSDQFTTFGKVSVGLLYFAFWILLMFPKCIALGGGVLMIVYRYVLYSTGQGPMFDAENVIIMEPLYLLFGLMLTTVYLEKMESGGLFDRLRLSLDDPINWKRSAKIMAMSTIGSAAVMNDSIVLIFSAVVVDLCVRHKVANSMPYMLSLATFYARQAAGGKIDIPDSWSLWSKLQIVVVLGFLFFFAGGFDVSTVSISAGVVLMTLMAWKRQSFDAKPEPESEPKKMYDVAGNEIEPEEEELITESETTLTVVDYGLLLLFIGQFLLIGSFDDTGLPQAFFAVAMGGCAADMTSVPCVYWFVAIVTILSNVASNVPVCQMLAATFPYATPYEWLQVSFSATVAGNLTMLGSAANMIVAFQAAKVGDRTFTSERHAPFGIPSTIFSLYAGTAILVAWHFSPNCSVKLGDCDWQQEE